MWDPYYGKQANPYGVDEFKLIYKALAAQEQTPEIAALLTRTHKALAVESGLDDLEWAFYIEEELGQHTNWLSDGQKASIMKLVKRGKFEAALGSALAVVPEDHARCFEKHLDRFIEFQKLVEGLAEDEG